MNANNLLNDLTAGLFAQSSGMKNKNFYGSYLFANKNINGTSSHGLEQRKTSAKNAMGKDFGDILSSTIGQENDASQRQIRNSFSKTDKIHDGIKKPGTATNVFNEAKVEMEEKGRQVIKKAAQMLGIGAEELTSVLASMNISLSDLGGNLPVETLVNQVDEAAGLDMSQKNMLGGILSSARESVYYDTDVEASVISGLSLEKPEGTMFNEIKGTKAEAVNRTEGMSENTSAAAEENIEGHSQPVSWNKFTNSASTAGDKPSEVNELVVKLQDGAKAKEPGENLDNTKDANMELNEVPDTSGRTDNILTAEYALQTKEPGMKNNKVQDGNIESFNAKTDENPEPAAAQAMQNNGHGGTDGSSQGAPNWDRKVEVFKVDVSSKNESFKADDLFQGILAPQMEAETGKAVKADIVQKSIPVAKEEVLSQIVEKAKVIIDGGKSEMVMELKPESLGKLSLKIIHERGMILAKFTAESEQVKQVLETNMQLLKDVLQRQGLSVQGFDVSVGQDASARQQAFESGNRRKSDKLQTGPVSNTLLRAEQFTGSDASRYNWSQSSINLTA